jgi:hypothetical protein
MFSVAETDRMSVGRIETWAFQEQVQLADDGAIAEPAKITFDPAVALHSSSDTSSNHKLGHRHTCQAHAALGGRSDGKHTPAITPDRSTSPSVAR